MKKSELKAGYTLLDEKGRYWYLFQTKKGLEGLMIDEEGKILRYNSLNVTDALNEDLTLAKNYLNPSCDIVAVYSYPEWLSSITTARFKEFPLLWKRKKTKKVFRMWKLIEVNKDSVGLLVDAFKAGWPAKYEGKTFEECKAIGFDAGDKFWFVEEEINE